jgi:hypothetical protein
MFVNAPGPLVVIVLELAPAGARFVVALMGLVTAVATDDTVPANPVVACERIGQLKIGGFQRLAESVRRATQNSSPPSRSWHWPCHGLSAPARRSSLPVRRSRPSAAGSFGS